FDTFHDLYVAQLQDLRSAEDQLTAALPMMAEAATHPELKRGFEMHLEQTLVQRDRLDQILTSLGASPNGETCQAMKGLVKEGNEMIAANGDDSVRDAGLIAASQRVEHYEIAGYGTVATFAKQLGRTEDLPLLLQSLEEEKATDEKLTTIAEQVVNPDAARA
ncbi:MAG TPA: ferritin-like domain-containing protein, partial [Rubricoccaceae bacterium]